MDFYLQILRLIDLHRGSQELTVMLNSSHGEQHLSAQNIIFHIMLYHYSISLLTFFIIH